MKAIEHKIQDYKMRSKKCPSLHLNPNILIFTQQVMRELARVHHQQNDESQGLFLRHQLALKKIKANTNSVIKPADQGGNMVVMDNTKYVEMCNKILNNRGWNIKVAGSCATRHKNAFDHVVDQARMSTTILKETWEYIKTPDPKTPTFYTLLKINKSTISPPGRFIVSGISSLTEKASRVVDGHLKPHVMALPSHVRNTPHFLSIIEQLAIPPGAFLVTIDVEVLYSSILHDLDWKLFQPF